MRILIRIDFVRIALFIQCACVYICFIVIFGCTATSRHAEKIIESADVKKFLALLPLEERFVLDNFFRCLIQEDTIGYVLLGGKPMSVYSYIKPKTTVCSHQCDPLRLADLFFEGFDDSNAVFHKGWEVWKKYEHYFCGKNIFFDTFEKNRELHHAYVVVINKCLMLPLLDRYYHQFNLLDFSLKDKEVLFEAFLHNQDFRRKFHSRHDLSVDVRRLRFKGRDESRPLILRGFLLFN
jgi:hypothetical protein